MKDHPDGSVQGVLEGRLTDLFAAEPSPSVAAAMDARVGPILARPRPMAEPRGSVVGRRRALAFAGSTVAVALGAALIFGVLPRVVAPSSGTGDGPVTVVRSVSGYPLDNAPAAAAAFSGNRVVILGTVAAIEDARWSSDDRDVGHIYRPVRVDVIEVLRGDVPGTNVTVRSLGGEADGVRMKFSDAAPLADVPLGTSVLLFLGDSAGGDSAGDGGPPGFNMAYVVEPGGRATSFPDEQHSIALQDFRRLLTDTDMSSTDAEFWSGLRIAGDEAEGYASLKEMKAEADAVVIGTFGSFEVGRRFQADAPEDVTAYAVAEVVVKERLGGLVPDRLKLEFLWSGPIERVAEGVTEMADTMPTGDLVLFLRAKRGANEDGLYRVVNSVGLWAATDRADLDTPLGDESSGISLYAEELRSVRSLADFVREIKEL